jgi:hypothetical protein
MFKGLTLSAHIVYQSNLFSLLLLLETACESWFASGSGTHPVCTYTTYRHPIIRIYERRFTVIQLGPDVNNQESTVSVVECGVDEKVETRDRTKTETTRAQAVQR